jgi:arylsulfatase A-like enzyme
MTTDRPNILLIQSDKHRWDCMGVNGASQGTLPTQVKTPHLDRLAAEGMNFTHAFCPVPLCTPARTSLLTGQWPTENLCIANPDTEAPRPHIDGLPTYSSVLHDAGYWLGYLDKWHVNHAKGPEEYGFDEVAETWRYGEWRKAQGLPPRGGKGMSDPDWWLGHVDEGVTPEQSRLGYAAGEVIRMLEESAKREQPFMIAWEPGEPHLPQFPCEPFASMYPPESIRPWPGFEDDLAGKNYGQAQQKRDWGVDGWTWEQWAPYVARYFGVISLLDSQVGRILDALDRLGLAENTLVIYTADHGDPAGEHGLADQHFILYDSVMRVPLIARWPGVIEPGQTNDAFVSNAVDLCRTFVEAAGADVPDTFSGESLLPLFAGGGNDRPDMIGAYHGNQFGLFSMRMIRDRSWKYIWCPAGPDELYDLDADPAEVHNLATAPAHAAELARLRNRLVAWMDKIGDRLLNPWTRTSLLEGRSV